MTLPSPHTPLEQLERLRTIGACESETVLKLGKGVLGDELGLGESEWAIREQVAVAALDVGDLPFAETQIAILGTRFPASPRLEILRGMRLEADGEYAGARAVYERLIAEDECNVSAHQRLIALSLYGSPSSSGGAYPAPTSSALTRTVPLLVSYLTTFHTDPSAWGLLADAYLALSGWPSRVVDPQARAFGWWFAQRRGKGAQGDKEKDKGKYLGQARNCLGQRMLLEPFNWVVMGQMGEVALMEGDAALAYRTFLRAVEMATDPEGVAAGDVKGMSKQTTSTGQGAEAVLAGSGALTRLWWWIEICLLELDARSGEDDNSAPPPDHAGPIRELARERIRAGVGAAADPALAELATLVRR